jgi:hypothetical protein
MVLSLSEDKRKVLCDALNQFADEIEQEITEQEITEQEITDQEEGAPLQKRLDTARQILKQMGGDQKRPATMSRKELRKYRCKILGRLKEWQSEIVPLKADLENGCCLSFRTKAARNKRSREVKIFPVYRGSGEEITRPYMLVEVASESRPKTCLREQINWTGDISVDTKRVKETATRVLEVFM